MNLSRLLPNAAKNVNEEKVNNILYLCLTEWGWSWDQFINTPIPVLMRLFKKHEEVQKEQKKKSKK